MIITISGKAEAGKDFTASLIKEEFEERGKRVFIIHYADYLKFICEKYFGWDGTKSVEGREILQQVGTNIVRQRMPDFWVNTVVEFLKVFGRDYDVILIPDCRFPNEVEIMKVEFDQFVSLNVIREDHVSKLTEEQLQHPSEIALDGYDFDWTIKSKSGVEALRPEVRYFVDIITKLNFL